MTAAEAAGMPHVVGAIGSRADVDRRTVVKCLRGQSPYSTIWEAVSIAAQALGVSSIPVPPPRKTRLSKPCAECERMRARVAEILTCRRFGMEDNGDSGDVWVEEAADGEYLLRSDVLGILSRGDPTAGGATKAPPKLGVVPAAG